MSREIEKNRPDITQAVVSSDMSVEERFQNSTIRPIVKMQHELLILHYRNYLIQKKCPFVDWSTEMKMDFINRSFLKDNHLRNEFKGMIIGHFTTVEYQEYTSTRIETNKRIINIIKERILSNIRTLS